MWLTSLLPSLKWGTGRRANILRKRPTSGFVPRLEILEDRSLLSTLTVLNNLDSGAGSLRYAIGHSRDGDTIVFDQSVTAQTITLTSGDLDIKNSLDIQGPGASLLAISGNDTSRVFDISKGLTVRIAGLTITHGRTRGSGGAGIRNAGSTLTLANDVFSYNEAVEINGGAISSLGNGTLTVTDSTFVSNQILGEANGGIAQGGAMFIDNGSTATVSHSTFVANRAVGGDGGVVHDSGFRPFIGGAEGGAIHNDGRLTIEASTFTANQAVGGNGGSGGNGANFYSVGFATGGAIFNHPTSEGKFPVILVINASTFSDNEAIGGSGATGGTSGQGNVGIASGGALFNFGVITVTNSTFDHNLARGGDGNRSGGGPATIGRGAGGAIVNSGLFGPTFVTVSNSTFTNNQAVGASGSAGSVGGLALGGAIADISLAATTVTGSTFTGNQAIGGAGGVGSNGGNGLGGGIYNDGRSTLEVRGSTITDNQASGGAAGDGGSAGSGIGGGLYLAPGGGACLDEFTIEQLFGNLASTSDDDLFGDYLLCE